MYFLTGMENSGKALFFTFHVSPDGHEQHDVVINKVETDKEGGDWSTDIQVNNQCYYDLVNIIREHEEVFPAWHSSTVVELYKPKIFKNKKKSSAYWF